MENKKKKLPNRAFSQDRPTKANQCRTINTSDPKHPCKERHSFVFYRFDNYGYCKNCGSEILT